MRIHNFVTLVHDFWFAVSGYSLSRPKVSRSELFDVTENQSFWCSTMQSYHELSTKALSILVHFAAT